MNETHFVYIVTLLFSTSHVFHLKRVCVKCSHWKRAACVADGIAACSSSKQLHTGDCTALGPRQYSGQCSARSVPVRNGPIALSRTAHPNNFTLDRALGSSAINLPSVKSSGRTVPEKIELRPGSLLYPASYLQ